MINVKKIKDYYTDKNVEGKKKADVTLDFCMTASMLLQILVF